MWGVSIYVILIYKLAISLCFAHETDYQTQLISKYLNLNPSQFKTVF